MENRTEEIEPHPDYVEGYNQGYFLAREIPQFATDMANYMPGTERGMGFGKGVEQYSRDLSKEKSRSLEKDFRDSRNDIGLNKNSPDNLSKDYTENIRDMGLESKTHLDAWLVDKDDNMQDMGIDREPEMDHDDHEPELD